MARGADVPQHVVAGDGTTHHNAVIDGVPRPWRNVKVAERAIKELDDYGVPFPAPTRVEECTCE